MSVRRGPDSTQAVDNELPRQPPAGRAPALRLLALLACVLALQGLGAWTAARGGDPALHGALALAGWLLLLALLGWAALGAWRAGVGMRARRDRMARAAVAATLVLLGLTMIAAVAALALQALPAIGPAWSSLRGNDPLGGMHVAVSDDGRRLRLGGAPVAGDAQRLRGRLLALPGVWLVELDLAGGRQAEAAAVAAALREWPSLQLRVVGHCDDACVLVWLAGRSRQLAASGQVGFHRLSPAGVMPALERWANRLRARDLQAAGATPRFAAKVEAVPPGTVWRPERDELLDGGVLSGPAQPLEVDLPLRQGATLQEHADALAVDPLWRALDARTPGLLSAAAQQLYQARTAGVDDASAHLAAQRLLEPVLPRLVAAACEWQQEQYLSLLREQVAAAGADCGPLLAGDAASRRALPPPLREREAAWLAEALAEPVEVPRRLNRLEAEVMNRSLGGAQAVRLAGLWHGSARRTAAECRQDAALLEAVATLAPPERRLALRVLFGGSRPTLSVKFGRVAIVRSGFA